jgi:hypothetical protein
MAGQASGGQALTPNNNVYAPVLKYGGIYGQYGGGAVAVGGGATDQTGYVKPVAATASDGETATNYIPSTQKFAPSVIGQESNGALSGQNQDSALVSGGSNAG